MVKLVNRAKMTTASTGSGTITLGSASDGYQTFADAGVSNSDVVRFVIEDGDAWELSSGTYTASGTTLTRTLGESSTGSLLNLTGSAVVFVTAAAADIGLTLIKENYTSGTAPTASGNGSIVLGKDAYSTGTNTVAIGSQANAAPNNSIAIGELSATSNGYRQIALGYNSRAYAQEAIALGASYAGGISSLAGAIANNSSSYGATNTGSIAMGNINKAAGYESFVAGGYANAANNYRSFVIGGNGNTVSTNYGAILGGEGNTVNSSSNYGVILNGEYNEINRAYTVASGKRAKTTVDGQVAHSAGHFASAGDAQGSKFILRAATTDATATALTTTLSTASAYNQIVAASDTCITFDGTITAMQNGAQAFASWRIEGLLVNDGGTTTLANSSTTVIDNQSDWVMALSADDTNNALAITCTGEASHNIRWVANIRTTEVTYA